MQNKNLLEVKEIFASYFKRVILHNVSLEAKKKEIVGIIGPNGAGKSTLLKAIFGIIQSKGGNIKGKIIFDGKDITQSKPKENVKKGIGYLLQGGEIFSNLSVEDNLSLVMQNGAKGEINKRKEYIYSIFPKLLDLKKKRAGLLSGGERQMLAIGMILMLKPKLILLDEPTASLSQDMADIIINAILKIRKEEGTSVLLVEQNIERSLKISDRIYLMRDGEIIGEGCPADLATVQKIKRLFLFGLEDR